MRQGCAQWKPSLQTASFLCSPWGILNVSVRADKTISMFLLLSSEHFSQLYPKTWGVCFLSFYFSHCLPHPLFPSPPLSQLPCRNAMAIYLHLVSLLQFVCMAGRKVHCHSWAFTPAKANELSLTLILTDYLELHTPRRVVLSQRSIWGLLQIFLLTKDLTCFM